MITRIQALNYRCLRHIDQPMSNFHVLVGPNAIGKTTFLSSVYSAQVLMATHSSVMLSLVETDHILCFAKDEQGATDIVVGSRHPALAEWHGEPNLNVLFAAGVLS
jgi:predicted ATPase